MKQRNRHRSKENRNGKVGLVGAGFKHAMRHFQAKSNYTQNFCQSEWNRNRSKERNFGRWEVGTTKSLHFLGVVSANKMGKVYVRVQLKNGGNHTRQRLKEQLFRPLYLDPVNQQPPTSDPSPFPSHFHFLIHLHLPTQTHAPPARGEPYANWEFSGNPSVTHYHQLIIA